MNDRFDRDPEALAWARANVQHHIDRLAAWEEQATEKGEQEQAMQCRRMRNFLDRSFIGGRGCVIAAFDERLPAHRELLDGATVSSGHEQSRVGRTLASARRTKETVVEQHP